jgi:hypothetical protein
MHNCLGSYILSAIRVCKFFHVVDHVRERKVLRRCNDAKFGQAAEVGTPPTLSEEAHDALIVLWFWEPVSLKAQLMLRRLAAYPGSASPGSLRHPTKLRQLYRWQGAPSGLSRGPLPC